MWEVVQVSYEDGLVLVFEVVRVVNLNVLVQVFGGVCLSVVNFA